jgi:hypothetical protein
VKLSEFSQNFVSKFRELRKGPLANTRQDVIGVPGAKYVIHLMLEATNFGESDWKTGTAGSPLTAALVHKSSMVVTDPQLMAEVASLMRIIRNVRRKFRMIWTENMR